MKWVDKSSPPLTVSSLCAAGLGSGGMAECASLVYVCWRQAGNGIIISTIITSRVEYYAVDYILITDTKHFSLVFHPVSFISESRGALYRRTHFVWLVRPSQSHLKRNFTSPRFSQKLVCAASKILDDIMVAIRL